jgi:hypothetical protein
MSERVIACCGLVCSECGAFRATKASDPKQARQTAEQWARDYKVQVAVDDVWCDGCMALGVKCAHAKECEIRACGRELKVSSCAACADYPCAKLGAFLKLAPQAKATLEGLRARR